MMYLYAPPKSCDIYLKNDITSMSVAKKTTTKNIPETEKDNQLFTKAMKSHDLVNYK